METTRTMKDIVLTKLNSKLEKGAHSTEEAINKLLAEKKISQDCIAPLGARMRSGGAEPVISFDSNGHVKMTVKEVGTYSLHDNAVWHLSDKLNIPGGYLRGLAGGKEQWQRDLAANVLNVHSLNTPRERVLIRSVGDQTRAVLSDHYRRLDSMDIFTGFSDSITANGAVLSDGHMDDTRFWVEGILPHIFDVPTNGETIYMFIGVTLSNSDFGDGALSLKMIMYQGVCLNGLVRGSQMRQIHLGSRLPDDLTFSDRTYRLDTNTSVSAVKDITRSLLSRESITRNLMDIQGATENEIDMVKSLENLVKSNKLAKGESKDIQQLIMRNRPEDGIMGASTTWKLTQAITAHARELPTRRQKELQEIAGDLLNNVKR